MGEVWVVNASPIITLAKAGHLGLVTDLAEQVLVPEAVVSEVLAGPEADPARIALERGWGQRVLVEEVPALVLEWSLGAGEAQSRCPSVPIDLPSPPPPLTAAPTLVPPRVEKEECARKRRRDRARLLSKSWLSDPERCPSYGERMRVVAAISSPGQDDVIEKILKSRGQWDPPWKRARKIRGPPPAVPGTPSSETRSSLSPREDWPEGVDPPHPDDDLDPPREAPFDEDGGEG